MTLTIQTFRKKPRIIEAVQFNGKNAKQIIAWVNSNSPYLVAGFNQISYDSVLIDTAEGCCQAKLGDWIIKEKFGEFLTCTDNMFRQNYDEVDCLP